MNFLCKRFTELYFFYWLLVVSLAILIAAPVVFDRLQEYSKYRAYLTLLNITHNKTIKWNIKIINSLLCWSVTLLMFIQTLDSSQCKFGAYQKWKPAGRVGDFGSFLNFFAKSPLLPCIPHRSRLFWLNSSDTMEFSSWKRFIMWLLSKLLCKGSACFDRPEYWLSAICLAKL